MALTAAQVKRIQDAYKDAVNSCDPYVQLSQADVQACLKLNNAGDTVANAYTPSVPITPRFTGAQVS